MNNIKTSESFMNNRNSTSQYNTKPPLPIRTHDYIAPLSRSLFNSSLSNNDKVSNQLSHSPISKYNKNENILLKTVTPEEFRQYNYQNQIKVSIPR